jgi:hypothetical protein
VAEGGGLLNRQPRHADGLPSTSTRVTASEQREAPRTMVIAQPLPTDEIERLRAAGYVIVPLRPTEEMLQVGAPSCYLVPDGDWQTALRDAGECYRAMVELGCL